MSPPPQPGNAKLTRALAARTEAAERLEAAGVPSPEVDAARLLEAVLKVDRSELLLNPHRALTAGELRAYRELVSRRERREPLQLILGAAPFYGLDLRVEGGVLIPRPETERLVEIVLSELRSAPSEASNRVGGPRGSRNRVIIDVACGSGAIALALESELEGSEVWGGDLSEAAVSLARRNAAALGLEARFVQSDLLTHPDLAAAARRADAVVANPPYLPSGDAPNLPPEVRAEPAAALLGGEDGLDVARELALQAHALLPEGALLALELDPRNARAFGDELLSWRTVELHTDLAGRERFVTARK